MKKNIITLFVIVILFASCQTTSTIEKSHGRFLQADITTNTTPMAADLDVSSERFVYSETYSYELLNCSKNSGINAIEKRATAYALYEVAKKYNADVIVAPLTKMSITNSAVTITLCGYPATYKNFRKASMRDLQIEQTMKNIQE